MRQMPFGLQADCSDNPTYAHASRSAVVAQTVWNHEYAVGKTLPSTTNYAPSRCLAELNDIVGIEPGMHVLDLGSGNGRHSAMFAARGCRVCALDISDYALTGAERYISRRLPSGSVAYVRQSAFSALPFLRGGYSLILDSYMSCHVIDLHERAVLFESLRGALAPDGVFVSLCIGIGDAFYSSYATDANSETTTVCDPVSTIEKRLISERFASREYSQHFHVRRVGTVGMTDSMAGQSFSKQALFVVAGR